MNRRITDRILTMAASALAAALLLLADGRSFVSVRASSKNEGAVSQANLLRQLASSNHDEFRQALSSLTTLDEPDALRVWETALSNPDKRLQLEAWKRYQSVQAELHRKQFIPEVALIEAPANEVATLAASKGFDANIWSSSGSRTFAAVPQYFIEELKAVGVKTTVLYESIAEWQHARARGDLVAQAITPEYESSSAESNTLMRIAVIRLTDRGAAKAGFTDWVGDPEDIIMRDEARVAYLDIFQSDGSLSSINAHINQRYKNRGYKLDGFYTPEEFSDVAPRLFGKSFDAGKRAASAAPGKVHLELDNGKYHSYDQTTAEFKALAGSHPDLARYVKLGSSFEGRDIFVLKISRDASVDDASKPDVLITGCHHAREWISVEAPVYIAHQLLDSYSTDDSIRYLVDHLQIWIVPIVNPDGLTYTQGSPNDQMDPVRLWRKNRRPIPSASCVSAVGVDLNRNYSYEWRLQGDAPCSDYCSSDKSCVNDDIGASDDPNSEIFRGASPESEPEVKAVKSLVDDPNRHFRAQIDYHNYSQLILYPWGYTPFGTEDSRTLSDLAKRMSDDLFGVSRMAYKPEQAVDLYALTGSSSDYAYGVNRVPAPFVIEMRPDCCDFSVPETQIPVVNQENWAAAKSLLSWASGPPILESVRAYEADSSGAFSKLIYSARWVAVADDLSKRQLVVDTRFPGIDPGRLQVRLQFSKPMNSSLGPNATMGRDVRLDELSFASIESGEGWQKTNYANDTWIGEAVMIQDQDTSTPWTLGVSSTDQYGYKLDANPATLAGYIAGATHWQQYEDSTGADGDGGTDSQHVMGPGVRSDFPNVLIASPNGGERLAAGDDYTIQWTSPNAPGFGQTLLLSTDGVGFTTIADNIPSNVQSYRLTMPLVSTTRARIRLLALDPGGAHNTLIATSQGDFSIGSNVGSNVDIRFLSGEKLDLNWADTSSDDTPVSVGGASRLAVNVQITNTGSIPIVNPFVRVSELTRNVLISRDPKTKWTEGAIQSIDAGPDNSLSPGETAKARLVIGLINLKKFSLSIGVYGVPSGGTIIPSQAITVWTGKPKTR